MTDSPTLSDLERRAFASHRVDGLLDLYLGVMLLLTPLSILLRDHLLSDTAGTAVTLCLLAAAGIGYVVLEKRLTATRLGRVTFGAARRRRGQLLILALAVSAGIGVIVFVLSLAYWRGDSTVLAGLLNNPALLGALVGAKVFVILSLIGFFLEFRRGYALGLIFGLSIGLDIGLGEPVVFPLAGGLVLCAMGAVYFARFLRENPAIGQQEERA